MEYTLVVSRIYELASKVNRLTNDGWELHGQPFLVGEDKSIGRLYNIAEDSVVAQAMTRPKWL